MKLSALKPRNLIVALVFLITGAFITHIAPSIEVAWVSAFLLLTIYLFAFEVVSVDVAAITIMVLLGLTVELAPFMGLDEGLVSAHALFDGFASNAVISIIAVMIIGAGLDKTGIMSKVAAFILRLGGATETRIIPIISGTVGIISSFMQNVGAAALFLPVVSRISARTGLPLSRLLMPMGFTAILGGTVTMVGSSPLILLNDLMHTSNQALPEIHHMQPWELFAVTPIGLALVATGIIYFVLAGRMVLPASADRGTSGGDAVAYFRQVYGLDYGMTELAVPADSELVGKTVDQVEALAAVRIVAIAHQKGEMHIGPNSLSREVAIGAGSVLGVMADPMELEAFTLQYGLQRRPALDTLGEVLANTRAGIAELVIPPGSRLIGKSARELWLRKSYGLALLALHRGRQTLREGDAIRDLPLEAGDTLVGHIPWEALAHLEKDRNFVVVTTEYPHEEMRPHKVAWAMAFFFVALFMVLFTEVRLSVALMTGALGMILSGVLNIEEAYKAVSWKTVFLLASLIPLGMAVESSGTAKWIAESSLSVIGHMPTWVIQTAVAILATFFTLVMSNVGATVLLVPLAVNIAIGVGANPAVFALTVAIATSNSFLIPTHQVNALIMGPAGYRVPDFMRAGGIMTILFLVVSIGMLNIIF
jgi:di/tricarboxylate transporter